MAKADDVKEEAPAVKKAEGVKAEAPGLKRAEDQKEEEATSLKKVVARPEAELLTAPSSPKAGCQNYFIQTPDEARLHYIQNSALFSTPPAAKESRVESPKRKSPDQLVKLGDPKRQRFDDLSDGSTSADSSNERIWIESPVEQRALGNLIKKVLKSKLKKIEAMVNSLSGTATKLAEATTNQAEMVRSQCELNRAQADMLKLLMLKNSSQGSVDSDILLKKLAGEAINAELERSAKEKVAAFLNNQEIDDAVSAWTKAAVSSALKGCSFETDAATTKTSVAVGGPAAKVKSVMDSTIHTAGKINEVAMSLETVASLPKREQVLKSTFEESTDILLGCGLATAAAIGLTTLLGLDKQKAQPEIKNGTPEVGVDALHEDRTPEAVKPAAGDGALPKDGTPEAAKPAAGDEALPKDGTPKAAKLAVGDEALPKDRTPKAVKPAVVESR